MNGKLIAELNNSSDRSKSKEFRSKYKQTDETQGPGILLWTASELAFWG